MALLVSDKAGPSGVGCTDTEASSAYIKYREWWVNWTGFCSIYQDRERGRNARIERWAGRNSGIEREGGNPDRETGENFRLERHGRTL